MSEQNNKIAVQMNSLSSDVTAIKADLSEKSTIMERTLGRLTWVQRQIIENRIEHKKSVGRLMSVQKTVHSITKQKQK